MNIKKKINLEIDQTERKTDILLRLVQLGTIFLGFTVMIAGSARNIMADEVIDNSAIAASVELVTTVETTTTSADVIETEPRILSRTIDIDDSIDVPKASFDEIINNSISSISETSVTDTKVNLNDELGSDKIEIDGHCLTRCDLPNKYYPNLDYSTFQPYMDYRTVNVPNSSSYPVVYGEGTYVDNKGFRRYPVSDKSFNIDSEDDYMIALGTFYKPKGVGGMRYLIVTSTGMYTAISGDEKGDADTDPYHMFSYHSKYGGLIEWLVDTKQIEKSVRRSGTITSCSVEKLKGEIEYIYVIES